MKTARDLMVRYFDGGLSDGEIRELQAALLSDPELCEEFVGAAEMHGRLFGELGGGEVLRLGAGRRLPRWVPAVSSLAAGFVVLAAGWWLLGPGGREEPPAGVVVPENERVGAKMELAVARVIFSREGRWGLEGGREVEVGEWLLPGSYHLQAGEMVMALDVGGTARVEAPAVFEIISGTRIRLESGSLQARFEEPGQGFTVVTPEGDVVDLGTEFRVVVSGRESRAEVVEGRVRATAGSTVRELGEKEGVSMQAGGMTAFAATATDPMADEFENGHPVVYYHWGFEDVEAGRFPATGSAGAGDYALVPGLPGREPEKVEGVVGGALRFSGTGEFLVSPYRGVSGSNPRTVAAWVRIPADARLEESYGWAGWGLLHEKGDYSTAQKWQLCWNPQVRLESWSQPLSPGAVVGAIRTEFGPGWVNGSRDLRDGSWHHLVSIFIGGENSDVATHIRHYVDGRLEETSGYQRSTVRTGTGEESLSLLVGHHMNSALWMAEEAKKTGAERTKWRPYFSGFRGDLDELYIFEGALTPVQVWRLYKDNRPPEPGMISPSLGTLDF